MAHRSNVASLRLFYRYYLGRCSSELAQLFTFPFSRGRSALYSDRLHDFSLTIPVCYKDVFVNSSFPCTARLWYSLPIECFPLTFDLNGFTSRTNRHLLKSVFHVFQSFCQIKLFPNLVQKNTSVCLVFKTENNWIL